MSRLQYNFSVSDSEIAEKVQDYVYRLKEGINLTEEYLPVYPQLSNSVLEFDIVISSDLKPCLAYRFLREFMHKFHFEIHSGTITYSVEVI